MEDRSPRFPSLDPRLGDLFWSQGDIRSLLPCNSRSFDPNSNDDLVHITFPLEPLTSDHPRSIPSGHPAIERPIDCPSMTAHGSLNDGSVVLRIDPSEPGGFGHPSNPKHKSGSSHGNFFRKGDFQNLFEPLLHDPGQSVQHFLFAPDH